jgi:hypothetical protein
MRLRSRTTASLRPWRVWDIALAVGLVILVAAVLQAADPPAGQSLHTEAVRPAGEGSTPQAGSLALLPASTVAFLQLPNLRQVEEDLKRFAERTGWSIGEGEHPLLGLLAARTGIEGGLDPEGSASIGFLDPKLYRERYTIYILPVADWKTLLDASRGEEMAPDLYALTGTSGPCFVARRGKFAIVTSSIRTMDAVAEADRLAPTLPPEEIARAAGPGPLLHIDVHRLKLIYEDEIGSWFRAASGQLYSRPDAVPYADIFVTYMLGIAGFIDQMETAEVGLRFGLEGLSVDLSVRFVDGAAIAQFLSTQTPGSAPIPSLTDRPVTSVVTIRTDPKSRTDTILRATRFFLDKAPRPEPLSETDSDQVYQAVRVFAESLGPTMTLLSAPAAPGMGIASDVTILELKDPEQFQKGLELLVGAWETLADRLNLYLKFQAAPDPIDIEGVPVMQYIPRLRFGIPARHIEFRQQLRALYGPEGLVYRVAVVDHQAVVATGSDLVLFRQIIERLKTKEPLEPTPAMKQLQAFMPQEQQMSMAVNLPQFIGQALLRGGTSPDRLGTIDTGHQMVGLSLHAAGSTIRLNSYWPHEQLRLARELLAHAAPELTEAPKSMFEPSTEGPPNEGGEAPKSPVPAPPAIPMPSPAPVQLPGTAPAPTPAQPSEPAPPAQPSEPAPPTEPALPPAAP